MSATRSGGEGASAAGSRHGGREVALQVLYAIDLGETGPRDAAAVRAEKIASGLLPEPDPDDPLATVAAAVSSDEAFERIAAHFSVPKSAMAFARELVNGVVARSEAVDEIVSMHARNWRIARMAVVDRNVLRLAVYELRDTDTPVAVVIDEAVDLARRFGSDTSPAFVNGILDAVARDVRAA